MKPIARRTTEDVTLEDLAYEDGTPIVVTCHRISVALVAAQEAGLPGAAPKPDGAEPGDETAVTVEDVDANLRVARRVVPIGTSIDGERPVIGDGLSIPLEDLTDRDLLTLSGTILRLSGYRKPELAFRDGDGKRDGAGVGAGGAGEAAALAEPNPGDPGAVPGGSGAGGPDAADGGSGASAALDVAGATGN